MSELFFEDKGMRLLERSLDLSAQRQVLISSNLANVDTPGYKTTDLNFEEELKRATGEGETLALTHPAHMTVSNALRFSMAAQLLAGKFRSLKSAINEGR
jgi:flagellar basal-body rod protein FlgB